jgi:hypothetical protein
MNDYLGSTHGASGNAHAVCFCMNIPLFEIIL